MENCINFFQFVSLIWAIIDAILQTICNYCRHTKSNILNSEFFFSKSPREQKDRINKPPVGAGAA